MGTENARIEKYQYTIHQNIADNKPRAIPLLSLFDQKRQLLGIIAFIPDSEALQKPVDSPNGHVTMHMHQSRFASVIDMLRNEKPVYFSWWREAESFALSTSKEPVGEQELRKLFSILYV